MMLPESSSLSSELLDCDATLALLLASEVLDWVLLALLLLLADCSLALALALALAELLSWVEVCAAASSAGARRKNWWKRILRVCRSCRVGVSVCRSNNGTGQRHSRET